MLAIYSSASQLCYNHCTAKKKTLIQLWKVAQVAILKVEHCVFCIWKLICTSIKPWGLFFNFYLSCSSRSLFFKKITEFIFSNKFLHKVLWKYKWDSKCNKPQCSTFKIATCETFLKLTNNLKKVRCTMYVSYLFNLLLIYREFNRKITDTGHIIYAKYNKPVNDL